MHDAEAAWKRMHMVIAPSDLVTTERLRESLPSIVGVDEISPHQINEVEVGMMTLSPAVGPVP